RSLRATFGQFHQDCPAHESFFTQEPCPSSKRITAQCLQTLQQSARRLHNEPAIADHKFAALDIGFGQAPRLTPRLPKAAPFRDFRIGLQSWKNVTPCVRQSKRRAVRPKRPFPGLCPERKQAAFALAFSRTQEDQRGVGCVINNEAPPIRVRSFKSRDG